MARSSLATAYIPSPASNHWGQRKEKIKKIIVHHAAGVLTAKALADLFANGISRLGISHSDDQVHLLFQATDLPQFFIIHPA